MVDIADSAPVRRASDDNTGDRHAMAEVSHRDALSPLAAVDTWQWRALGERAIEPNGYYLPEWALAANGSARHARTNALTAFDADARTLTGLIPVISAWDAYKLPLPALVSADPYRSLDTPLLDRDCPDDAAALLIDSARNAGASALILRFVPLEGAVCRAFTRALAPSGLRARTLKSFTRACLDATRDPDAVLREALGAKKLKELRRLRNRLGAHGTLAFAVARTAADVAHAFDIFLTLEASGWKGRRGTAMGQRRDAAARIRRAAMDLAERRQCEVVTLHAGVTPVAAGILLRHQDRAFFFKLGIDERFAKFSPGVQLTLELTRHLCADPEIAMADSTAAPNHPMIDPIWRGRLAIGDLLIPLYRTAPMVEIIHGALRAREFARVTALRILRR